MIVKLLAILWVAGIAVGFSVLAQYQFTPGKQLSAPQHLTNPSAARRPRLYVFLHPECPCSQATLGELEKIQASTLGRLDIVVELVIPRSGKNYDSAQLAVRARSNPRWVVRADYGGVCAAAMGAVTSGFVVLYNGQGQKCSKAALLSRGAMKVTMQGWIPYWPLFGGTKSP